MVSVGTKCTRQDSDISKDTLKGFIENIREFILEILRRNEGIEKIAAQSAFHCLNLAASTGNIRVNVECLPEVVKRVIPWPGTHIEQNANVWIQSTAESVEKPPVRVELALIFFLQAKYDLARYNSLLSSFETQV
jgi:hypothetical protein